MSSLQKGWLQCSPIAFRAQIYWQPHGDVSQEVWSKHALVRQGGDVKVSEMKKMFLDFLGM